MKYIIIGYLISQLITTVIFLATKQSEEKGLWAGGWVGMLLIAAFWRLWNYIRTQFIRKTQVALNLRREQPDGARSFHGYLETIRVKKKDVIKFYQEGENECYVVQAKGECIERAYSLKKFPKNGWLTRQYVEENFMKES